MGFKEMQGMDNKKNTIY